jgi:N utilization substance protein A
VVGNAGQAQSENKILPTFLFPGRGATQRMNADFLAVLEYWEREKGISRDVLVNAVHESLLAAAKKAVGPARELRCAIDPKSGDIRAYAKLIVSERAVSKHDQISLFDAKKINGDVKLGDELEVEVTPNGFGRIAAQYAKQSLLQHVRRAEKALIFDEFKDRVGDIVSGTVRRFDKSDVFIDLGRYEALMPSRERVPTEEYQVGERIRCYVKAVEAGSHGPEIILSRAAPEFVLKLFKLEVSEISDGTIDVKAIAREPGFRTKLAVWTRDDKVDPVGACVGLRGQRVKNIVRELNNEKVDIIRWDRDIRTFVTNALAPAKLKSLSVDEQNHRVRILTSEDQLSLAIGKRGQNARLTSRLVGWHVEIDAEEVKTVGFDEQIAAAVKELAGISGVSAEQAHSLVHHGFMNLDALLQLEPSDLADVPAIAEQAGAILEAARAEAARRVTAASPGEATPA